MLDSIPFDFRPREIEAIDGAAAASADPAILAGIDPGLPANGFSLRWQGNEAQLRFADSAAESYARRLIDGLSEYIRSERVEIPALALRDWPDFVHRGYMLDVSRDRVPTMQRLRQLVDELARLRYNELQLYTEHTFAYKGHEVVWGRSGALTADEIRELDAYAAERNIELVPNQNSFGHMERFLKHPEYRHLAECPDGFIHPGDGKRRPYGSVLLPCQESLDFVDSLYRELLPNFRCKRFHIGGDEAWELGLGRSALNPDFPGRSAIYARFLRQLINLCEQHGRQPLVWADELLKDGDVPDDFPPSAIPVIWGYEAGHPWREQIERVQQAGCQTVYLAPGTSCWNSFSGRYQFAWQNLRECAEAGSQLGCQGYLVTTWGDHGHHFPWVLQYPGMTLGAWGGWNHRLMDELPLDETLERVFALRQGAGALLIDSAAVEYKHLKWIHNESRIHNMFRAADATERRRWAGDHSLETWQALRAEIETLRERAASCADPVVGRDVGLMQDFNLLGVDRALATLRGESETSLRPRFVELLGRHEESWMRESRPGGLPESIAFLQGDLTSMTPVATHPSLVYSRKHRLQGYEVGARRTAKFATLLNQFQDIAESHASALGVSLDALQQRGLLWVLSRYHIRMHELPTVGDTISIQSWPSAWERLFAIRDFRVCALSGEEIGVASSAWLVVEAESFRPVRGRDLLPEFNLHPERALVSDWKKISLPDDFDYQRQFQVLHHDLDVNGHVNNAVYAIWALESAPDSCWQNHRPMEMEIQFLSMAFAGDTVRAETSLQQSAGKYILHHRLVKTSDQSELIRARSVWQSLD